MTLHDVNPLEIKKDSHLADLIHILLAHEADAETEYNNVINALHGHEDIKKILEEIRKDERNHMGQLLRCISILDATEVEEMSKEE